MKINELDQLDNLTDDQLWEVAANTRNMAEIRQEAIRLWLFPDETNPDADPDDLGGGRLYEFQQRASILDSEDTDEELNENIEEMLPYFDLEGRLILTHDGVSYLIDTLEDEGAYDGISTKDDLYTTDDKTNINSDL